MLNTTGVELFAAARPVPSGYRELDVVSLAACAPGRVRVIDVREPAEFTGPLGHVPAAELLPLGELPARCDAWDRDAEIVLVCRSGARSASAAKILVDRGFRRVMNLTGGTQAHAAAGLPVER